MQDKIISGNKILTSKQAKKILKAHNMLSDFSISNIPLVKNKETSHLLITGATGTGKSNAIYSLLPQIRNKYHPAIIVDFTGEMVKRYFDINTDIVLNPLDPKSHNWNFIDELSYDNNLVSNISLISDYLFVSNNNLDPFWNNNAKILFNDILMNSIEKDLSLTEIYRLLFFVERSELYQFLRNTESAVNLSQENEKLAASIKSTLISNISSLKYILNSKQKCNHFIISKWIASLNNITNNKKQSWLFLTASPRNRIILRPLISVWLNLIINNIMELGPNYDRRIWLVIDELAALNKIPSLTLALSEIRKYGGCFIAAMQSVNQLSKIYGYHDSLTMIDQFASKIIMRSQEKVYLDNITSNFGTIEYMQKQESNSYGANDMRDGISISHTEKQKLLVKPQDIANLADLECFASLPTPLISAIKSRIKIT